MGARGSEKDNTPDPEVSTDTSNLWSIVHKAVFAGWGSTARLTVLLLTIRVPLVIPVICYLVLASSHT
jgi:hypothetical protein